MEKFFNILLTQKYLICWCSLFEDKLNISTEGIILFHDFIESMNKQKAMIFNQRLLVDIHASISI